MHRICKTGNVMEKWMVGFRITFTESYSMSSPALSMALVVVVVTFHRAAKSIHVNRVGGNSTVVAVKGGEEKTKAQKKGLRWILHILFHIHSTAAKGWLQKLYQITTHSLTRMMRWTDNDGMMMDPANTFLESVEFICRKSLLHLLGAGWADDGDWELKSQNLIVCSGHVRSAERGYMALWAVGCPSQTRPEHEFLYQNFSKTWWTRWRWIESVVLLLLCLGACTVLRGLSS